MSPSCVLDRAEEATLVREAISSLNERQRAAFVLCNFAGRSYTEIARTMSTAPKMVKSLLAGRGNLRLSLGHYVREGSPLPA